MEPVDYFINDLEAFLESRDFELSGDQNGEIDVRHNGKLVGYFSGQVKSERFVRFA